MSERKTDDATLIAALRILARDIQSGDSCANAALLEAAARLAELVEDRRRREALWQASANETRLVYGGVFRPQPLPPGPEVDGKTALPTD